MRRVLSRSYTLDIADDGAVGLELAQAHPPDLILMDINLPGLNGYELATKFKALPNLSSVPIIAITANTMIGDRERALAAGCDGYISKPIDPRALPQQVAEYLGGSRERLPAAEAPTYMREYSQQLVTRLEEHIRELEAANERLLLLDKAKNDFLATISHELRSPLTVIHGYIDLLNMQALGPLTEQQRDATQLIQRNSSRLMRHINDLIFLQQVRSTELERETVDIYALVTRTCNDISRQISERQQTLTCTFNTDSGPLHIDLDEMSVENALRHMLDNASQYTPSGGTITISITPTPDDIVIGIQDTGIGIAAEDQQRIFEPFVRLDDTLAGVGGAGLGLVIANHVALAHGGAITLESAPGQGSTFALHIPRR